MKKYNYKRIILVSHLVLTILTLGFVVMCIIGTSVSLKYEIEEFYIISAIEQLDVKDVREYLLETSKKNYESFIHIQKILCGYFVLTISVLVYLIIDTFKRNK